MRRPEQAGSIQGSIPSVTSLNHGVTTPEETQPSAGAIGNQQLPPSQIWPVSRPIEPPKTSSPAQKPILVPSPEVLRPEKQSRGITSVAVGVGTTSVSVGVGDSEGSSVGSSVGVSVEVGVAVGVAGVSPGVSVAVSVGVDSYVGTEVAVGSSVSVAVGVAEGITSVCVDTWVGGSSSVARGVAVGGMPWHFSGKETVSVLDQD